jgi:CheY-like chemotaxis protein
MTPPVPYSPRILVIGSDPALRELYHEGLPWAGCAIEFVSDIADAMTNGFVPDIMLADLPTSPHTPAALLHLREFADVVGSTLIALTDDRSILAQAPISATCQVLVRPCPPETLWDALATAMTGRDVAVTADDWRQTP